MIGFIGSVFSPYYAAARRRGAGRPENHCAINIALYEPDHHIWAMTERSEKQTHRTATRLDIGPSSIEWQGSQLVIRIDETACPIPRKVKGTITLTPGTATHHRVDLDDHGYHSWWPIAPSCAIDVQLSHPNLQWTGTAYFDSNMGMEPLETGFDTWDWARSIDGDATTILYDVKQQSGKRNRLALVVQKDGHIDRIDMPPSQDLPRGLWRVPRSIAADPGQNPSLIKSLEDAPFYLRSIVQTQVGGRPMTAMHESLSLSRFNRRWVQMLLPFRMPRF